ncbi:MAG: hypothetical protein JWN44_6777 [Myxococcales bacterium]|nr:hypothetical protein [Myxococcales bacterium]
MSSTRVAVALALLLVATRALAAARTVTLLGVSGVGGARFATTLERELGELYELVPGERYRAAAARLGHPGASPDDVRQVAAAIGVDAIIGGAISGSGRARVLLVAVREGQSGRVLSRLRYDLGGRTLPVIRERVTADLVRALERVRPSGSAPSAAAPSDAGAASDDSGAAGSPGDDVTPAAAVQRSAAPRRAVAGVQAGVGPSLLTRSLGFDVASAPGYSGGTIAGIRAEGAVFPLALSAELAQEHPVLASFGLAGSYEYAFSFTSSASTGRSSGRASRWDVLLVGRIPLGHDARGGTLIVDTGLWQLSWSHAAPVDVGVPDVRYDLVGGGLGWERALGVRWLVFGARVGVMGLASAGDIAADTQYGRGTGWALALAGSLTLRPRDWLWVRLAGDWDRIALSFAGAGTRFARSASDNWIGGALEVGFAL